MHNPNDPIPDQSNGQMHHVQSSTLLMLATSVYRHITYASFPSIHYRVHCAAQRNRNPSIDTLQRFSCKDMRTVIKAIALNLSFYFYFWFNKT